MLIISNFYKLSVFLNIGHLILGNNWNFLEIIKSNKIRRNNILSSIHLIVNHSLSYRKPSIHNKLSNMGLFLMLSGIGFRKLGNFSRSLYIECFLVCLINGKVNILNLKIRLFIACLISHMTILKVSY
jgi:hypothetical protein